MTKQDFELIAQIIYHLDLKFEDQVYITNKFIDSFTRTYPRFDRTKFEDAIFGIHRG